MGRFSFFFGAFLLFVTLGCGKKTKPAVAPGTDGTPDSATDQVEDNLPKLADVMKKIKDKRPEQRMKGLADAALIKKPDMVAALVDLLKDSSCSPLGDYYPDRPYSTREAAVMALLQQGPDGEKALLDNGLKDLQAGLKDPDPAVKEHTAYAISLLGVKAKPATDDLIALCSAKEKEVRRAAYTALEKIPAVPPMPIIQLLKNPDPQICRDAAEAFTWLRFIPAEAVTVYIDVLKDDQLATKDAGTANYVRTTVADALPAIGSRAKEAIPALIDVLKKTKIEDLSQNKSLGEAPVLNALRKLGKPAVPALIELLNDPGPLVRWQAILVLGDIGPDAKEALEPLQATIEKEFERKGGLINVVADGALAQIRLGGDATKAVEKVITLLKLPNPGFRQFTVASLGRMGPKAEAAVPEMILLLDDPDENVRAETARSLRLMGPAAKAAVPALIKKLSDEDGKVRGAALLTLRGLGPVAAEAVPELTKFLAASDESTRVMAIGALKAIGPAAKSAVPELAKRLKSDSVKEQLVVIEMLPIFGASAKPAVSGLVSLLGEKKLDKDIEIATLDALGQIGPLEPSVIPEVVKKLGSTTGYIRIYAVKSLARMGPAAKPAADDLKKFGQSKDRTATIWAAAALARIGVDTSANVAIVLEAMQKSQPGPVRRAAMEAAEYLGPAGKPAVPILTELLKEKEAISKSDERSVRILAVTALGKMGELAKDVVPKLADFLKESDENLKRAVIVALGNIGPPASSTVGRLRDIARGDKNLSDEANEALAKIEPKAQ